MHLNMFICFFLHKILTFTEPREAFIKEIIIEDDKDDIISSEILQYEEKSSDSEFRKIKPVSLSSESCFVALTRDNPSSLKISNLHIKHIYKKYIHGFSFCTKNYKLVTELRMNPSVMYLEEDKYYFTSGTQFNIPNHLFYIANFGNTFFRNYLFSSPIMNYLPFNAIYKFFFGYYKYRYTGKNVPIYLFDTTVNTVSPDITGRVFNIYNKSSCSDHGTNVATLIAGKENSFAKDANINVLNIFDCQGKAPLSLILSTLELVQYKSLLCLPISGPKSEIFNSVVNQMAKNIVIVTSAGNNSDLGCNYSPGSAEGVINVGSVDKNANVSQFSNFNGCIKIYSLGEGFAFNNSSQGLQGTSYSAALVASSIAVYMESNPKADIADIWKYLVTNAYRKENSFFIQKIPDLETMDNIDKKMYSFSVNEDVGYSILVWYGVILTFVIFIVIFLIRRRKKEEDLII